LIAAWLPKTLRSRVGTTTVNLTFLGTRGEIDVRSRQHRRHSAALVQRGDARVMIDCGKDWLRRLRAVASTAIVLTHARSDHAWGLAEGAPCPVYATKVTWALIDRFPICDRREMPTQKSVMIAGVTFRACRVQHSIRAPAVGYLVSAKSGAMFYVPDVASLPHADKALRGIYVYIGDGATIKRSMVRRRGRTLIGHASIVAQLDWCRKAGVSRAIFTHCGSQIVQGDARRLDVLVQRLGRDHGIEACVARAGDRLLFPIDASQHAPS
jgi:phosphoribosyl 1,2-cyclic phosphodiesterase